MSQLTLTESDSIATIELNRPEKLNALSPELLRELLDCCEQIATRDSIRTVLIRGAGRSFCAGADLPAFNAAFDSDPHAAADLGRAATEAIWRLPQITVAAIHGHCVGGGLVVAACCDLRVASDSAKFSIPEVNAGIPLAWGGMGHLYRLIGETRATELVLSCRAFGADEATASGFLTGSFPENSFVEDLERFVGDLAARPQKVLRLIKSQLVALRDGCFDPHADADALLAARDDAEAQRVGAAYVDRLRSNS